MEHPLITIVLASIISLLLPKWVLLVFCVPMLMVLSVTEMISPILSLGDADIEIYDYILFIINVKIEGGLIKCWE